MLLLIIHYSSSYHTCRPYILSFILVFNLIWIAAAYVMQSSLYSRENTLPNDLHSLFLVQSLRYDIVYSCLSFFNYLHTIHVFYTCWDLNQYRIWNDLILHIWSSDSIPFTTVNLNLTSVAHFFSNHWHIKFYSSAHQ